METPFAAPAKLHEGGPCSQNRLGRLIDLDVAAIKGIVDRLRTRGFGRNRRNPIERLRPAVALTGDAAADDARRDYSGRL